MMTLIRKGKQTCPVIYCDVCGKRITDVKMALYVWNWGAESEYAIIHKNICDDRHFECSMELSYFFIYLMRNVGMEPSELKDTIEGADLMETLTL